MLEAVRFSYAIPGRSQGLPESFREGNGQPNMKVGNTARLELKNPEVTNTRSCTAESNEPGI
jgi:hypothetical protein